MDHIAIVGASLAGLTAAETIREGGFEGVITVVDGSAVLPSDRPPLSKQVLAGTMEPERAASPVASRLDSLGLTLRLGVRATALSVADRRLTLDDGSELVADGLVIATGASPRRLDTSLAGVHTLRDLGDSLAIRADLDAGSRRVVVIGAGFIGAEVAATCRGLGLDVTMIETQPWPLQRVFPPEIGRFIADLHSAEGVDVRLGVGVDHLEGVNRVERVVLTDGAAVEADVVVAGIGVTPSVGWLDGSGLDLGNGIVCDETCAAAPGVFAAGDVACWPNPAFGGELMRVEQWENAIEQGEHVGRQLLASAARVGLAPFSSIPWFWSDQYTCKIQLAGRASHTDEFRIVEGSMDERRFVAIFGRGDICTAVLGVNRPRHVVQLRMRMAEGGLSVDDAIAHFA